MAIQTLLLIIQIFQLAFSAVKARLVFNKPFDVNVRAFHIEREN